MGIKQISVFMENTPGSLAKITRVLAEHTIDLRAVSIADTVEYGVLRMIVNDPLCAESVLRREGLSVNLTDVTAVSVADGIGALHRLVAELQKEAINIDYIYSFIGEKSSQAVLVFKTGDDERAAEVLTRSGAVILAEEDFNNQ